MIVRTVYNRNVLIFVNKKTVFAASIWNWFTNFIDVGIGNCVIIMCCVYLFYDWFYDHFRKL